MTHEAADDLRLPVDSDSSGDEADAVPTEDVVIQEEVSIVNIPEDIHDDESEIQQEALLQPEPEALSDEALPVVEAPEVVTPAAPENFWEGLWGKLFPSKEVRREQVKQRLMELDATIKEHPSAAGNYVMRGEIYLDLGHYELALNDFQNALEIAIYEVENNRWGVIAQIMQDRALRGLNRAKQYLPQG